MTSSLSAQTLTTATGKRFDVRFLCTFMEHHSGDCWGLGTVGSWDLTVGYKDLGSGIWDGIDRSTPLGYFWV